MTLHVQNLSVAFGDKTVLQNFGLTLEQGETACLLGHSGCGKTTALRAIAGFETPSSGTVSLHGRLLNDTPAHRRQIGMVFQDYALFPHLNVADNIAFGLHRRPRSERRQRVAELLALTGLDTQAKQYPHQLSGGQQQRVALARALAPKPDLILLDEPFSNLDADLRTRLSKEVRQLLKQQNTAAIMVTHDQQEAFVMADKIGVLRQGRLVQWSDPYTLYRRPADAETACFIGSGALISGQAAGGGIQTGLGLLPAADAAAFASGQAVRVLIRPDDIVFDPSAAEQAEVLEQDFKGGHFLYTLRLTDGSLLPAHSAEHLDIGQRLGVRYQGAAAVAFPL
ncbi:MAG: ABC transporter ATP-binding protein [Eikenella sp.]|nr:ABC transporter ATP-binding protein [Eikenella sp.]